MSPVILLRQVKRKLHGAHAKRLQLKCLHKIIFSFSPRVHVFTNCIHKMVLLLKNTWSMYKIDTHFHTILNYGLILLIVRKSNENRTKILCQKTSV